MLEDWRSLPHEVKLDLVDAVNTLSLYQRIVIVLFIWGYDIQQIQRMVKNINVVEYLHAAILSIANTTGYTDYSLLRKAKGEVKQKWITQCTQIAQTW